MTKNRVLIVDDEALIAMYLKKDIEKRDSEVEAFVSNDFRNVVSLCEEIKPSCVVLDVNLNSSVSGDTTGIKIANILKNKGFDVLFMSSYPRNTLEKELKANCVECFQYMQKPISGRQLLPFVQNHRKEG